MQVTIDGLKDFLLGVEFRGKPEKDRQGHCPRPVLLIYLLKSVWRLPLPTQSAWINISIYVSPSFS